MTELKSLIASIKAAAEKAIAADEMLRTNSLLWFERNEAYLVLGCVATPHNILTLTTALASKDAEIKRLKEALKPFADAAKKISQAHLDGHASDDDETYVFVGDLRRAREASGVE